VDLDSRPIDQAKSKASLVYERLSEAIFNGSLAPLDRLNADEIARKLSVSKIPVREALQRLELQGLVVQSPWASAIVAPLSAEEWQGIHIARVALEPIAARLAAEKRSSHTISTLNTIHDRMTDELAAGNLGSLAQHNREFHSTIASAAGYGILAGLIESTLLHVIRYRSASPLSADRWAILVNEHGGIIEAIRDGSTDLAESRARDHVNEPFLLGTDTPDKAAAG
jgi:DNA-binding GntR family transcriptional regulator